MRRLTCRSKWKILSKLTLLGITLLVGCGLLSKEKPVSSALPIESVPEEVIELEEGAFDLYDYERTEDFGIEGIDDFRVILAEKSGEFKDLKETFPSLDTLFDRYNLPEGIEDFIDAYDTRLVDLSKDGYIFDIFTNEQVLEPESGECFSVAYDHDTGAFFLRDGFPVEPTLSFLVYEFDILVSGEICLQEDGRIGAFKNNGTLALPEIGIDNFVAVATAKGVDLTGAIEDEDINLNLVDPKKKKASKKKIIKKSKSKKKTVAKTKSVKKTRKKVSTLSKALKTSWSKKRALKKVRSAKKPSSKRYNPPKKDKPKISLPKGRSAFSRGSTKKETTPKRRRPSIETPKGSIDDGIAKRLPRPNEQVAKSNPPSSYKGPSGKIRRPPSGTKKVKIGGQNATATRPNHNYQPRPSHKPRDSASEAASQLLGIRHYEKGKKNSGTSGETGKIDYSGLGKLDFDPDAKVQKTYKMPGGGKVKAGRLLGQGGFGQVKAIDVTDRQGRKHKFAAKTFNDPEELAQAQKAAEKARVMGDHPNFLKHYGTGVDSKGNRILISERGGKDLKSSFVGTLRNRNKEKKRQAMNGMVAGVGHMHKNNLTHGDIKLNNMILGSDGKPKIIDLDGITPASDSADNFPRDYTPGYVAPERLNKNLIQAGKTKKFSTKQSDVYSLGMSLLEVETGQSMNSLYKESFGKRYDEDKEGARKMSNGEFRQKVMQKHPALDQRRRTIFDMISPFPQKRPTIETVQSQFQ